MESGELESEGETECKRNGADISLACVVFGLRKEGRWKRDLSTGSRAPTVSPLAAARTNRHAH